MKTYLFIFYLITLSPGVLAADSAKKLRRENAQLLDQLEIARFKTEGLATEVEELKRREREQQKVMKKLRQEIDALKKKLAHLNAREQNLGQKLEHSDEAYAQKAREIDQLLKYKHENQALVETVAQLELKNTQLANKLKKEEQAFSKLQAQLAVADRHKRAQELSPSENISRDQVEREKIQARAQALWQGKRAPANAPEQKGAKPSLKEWLARHASEFTYDEKAHSILLNANQADLFKKASAELEETTKASLVKLARFLASARQSGELKARRLEIIGHASPSYRGNPIIPARAPASARQFNRTLSLARAEKAREFLLSLGGDFPTLTASGAGFEYPLAKTLQTPDSDACGAYDCARSRRLEIKIHP